MVEQDGYATAVKDVASGANRQLKPIEQVFFCLPFEHSESMADQDRSVAIYRRLCQEARRHTWSKTAVSLPMRLRQCHVIERFGRFLHRNAILGRESTPDAAAFLQSPDLPFDLPKFNRSFPGLSLELHIST